MNNFVNGAILVTSICLLGFVTYSIGYDNGAIAATKGEVNCKEIGKIKPFWYCKKNKGKYMQKHLRDQPLNF